MKVFIDANVLFAASNPASPTGRLIERVLSRAATVTCDYAWEEARRNVERKWPHHATGLAELMPSIEIVPTVRFTLPVTLADKDIPILCSAIQAGCSHLATGDKRDFGHLYDLTVNGVTIVTLLRLAEIVTGASS